MAKAIKREDLELVHMNPQVLKDSLNPANWRQHSRRQRQAYGALKAKVGWAGAVLLNKTTNNLLDGHMRVEEAIKNKEKSIPVLIGSWSKEQENLILQSLDPIGAMATTNKQALDSLIAANDKSIKDISDEANRKLAQLSQDLAELPETGPLIPQSKTIRKPKEKQDLEEPPTEYHENTYTPNKQDEVFKQFVNEDIFFPSSYNKPVAIPLQLPSLLEEKLATPDMAPTNIYAKAKGEKLGPNTYYCFGNRPFPQNRDGGVLGFFTEDYRFQQVYDFSANFLEELLQEDWTAILSPDFSLYGEHPFPLQLFNLYKSRWVSRFWQEAGFSIIPIIQPFNVPNEVEIIIHTLPRVVPVLACQARSLPNELVEPYCKLMNYACKTLKTETLAFYGGLDKKKYFHGYLKAPQVIYLPSLIAQRRKKVLS